MLYYISLLLSLAEEMIILPNTLKIFLIISILIFVVHVLNNVKKNKLSVRNSIVWLLMSVAIIISVFYVKSLTILAHFLGIKTLSNLFFFLGFIFLIFVVFDITKIISMQNKKIITLTQELGILRKELEDEKNK